MTQSFGRRTDVRRREERGRASGTGGTEALSGCESDSDRDELSGHRFLHRRTGSGKDGSRIQDTAQGSGIGCIRLSGGGTAAAYHYQYYGL